MRGKVSVLDGIKSTIGITPAYAGKRESTVIAALADYGSPPPMRGKAKFLNVHLQNYGITPAYAGKSEERNQENSRAKDHPRLCGEKKLNDQKSSSRGGSPPPMRGKAHKAYMTPHRSGITPAYAGKSTPVQDCSCEHEDHPRLCGEKQIC